MPAKRVKRWSEWDDGRKDRLRGGSRPSYGGETEMIFEDEERKERKERKRKGKKKERIKGKKREVKRKRREIEGGASP